MQMASRHTTCQVAALGAAVLEEACFAEPGLILLEQLRQLISSAGALRKQFSEAEIGALGKDQHVPDEKRRNGRQRDKAACFGQHPAFASQYLLEARGHTTGL